MVNIESLLYQFLVGIYVSSYYWLIACGLTLIFGITRVLNFAHGALFMLGGYFMYTYYQYTNNFMLSILLATFTVGLIGLFIERLVIKWLYKLDIVYQLLATIAITLISYDISRFVWGMFPLSVRPPPMLSGSINVPGGLISYYQVFVIVMAMTTFLVMYILLFKTLWGLKVRALAKDKNMSEILGINSSMLYAITFMIGSAIAGFGGALIVGMSPVTTGIGDIYVVMAFIIVVLAGLGNVFGTLVAAFIVGTAQSIFILLIPEIDIILIYSIMAMILLIKPSGLFGEK